VIFVSRDAGQLVEDLRSVIGDERVLQAIAEVPRDVFVPADLRDRAWENVALPIAAEQTISQPGVVARMCELLQLGRDDIVLDVGTGSGYHAAVLSRLAARVYSIERHAELSRGAQRSLTAAGIDNVTLLTGDGTHGHSPNAPYQAINVAAASTTIPSALEEQLAEGGRLIIPLDGPAQRLVLVRRFSAGLQRQELDPVKFVPLIGDQVQESVAGIFRLAEYESLLRLGDDHERDPVQLTEPLSCELVVGPAHGSCRPRTQRARRASAGVPGTDVEIGGGSPVPGP
jgi:protein-L-isoaspartate(D-aspartate) O-methyltransferase